MRRPSYPECLGPPPPSAARSPAGCCPSACSPTPATAGAQQRPPYSAPTLPGVISQRAQSSWPCVMLQTKASSVVIANSSGSVRIFDSMLLGKDMVGDAEGRRRQVRMVMWTGHRRLHRAVSCHNSLILGQSAALHCPGSTLPQTRRARNKSRAGWDISICGRSLGTADLPAHRSHRMRDRLQRGRLPRVARGDSPPF